MADAEHEVELKHSKKSEETAHRSYQNPTWLSLLSVTMMQQLARDNSQQPKGDFSKHPKIMVLECSNHSIWISS